MFGIRETTEGTISQADLTNAEFTPIITKVGDKFILHFVTDDDMIEIRLNEEQLAQLFITAYEAADYWLDEAIPYHV